MQHDYWHERWADGRIGFHEPRPNGLLIRWFSALSLTHGQRVCLPLCGKTLDIGWLLSCGYRVAGVELSELAVQELFDQLAVAPVIEDHGALKCYSAPDVDIFVGDIFELNEHTLGPVDAVYDRAALVALPPPMRARYADHLIQLTGAAPQLIISFDYDQSQLSGPPFSVGGMEINAHYSAHYAIEMLADADVQGGLKGACPAREQVWRLSPNARQGGL